MRYISFRKILGMFPISIPNQRTNKLKKGKSKNVFHFMSVKHSISEKLEINREYNDTK